MRFLNPACRGRKALTTLVKHWPITFGVGFLVVVVAVAVNVVGTQNEQRAEDAERRSIERVHDAEEGRRVLCEFVNRVVDGARLDRQFLVVLSTRPGVPSTPERDATVTAYLDFGDLAYPHLDCTAVVAGGAPPPLPPLPPSPLGTTPAPAD